MASKPPVFMMPPTLRRASGEPQRKIWKKAENPAIGIQGVLTELDIACQIGENPNSERRFLRLLSAILPEQLNMPVPGKGYPARELIERLSICSIHNSVRLAAVKLLESEIIVVQSDTPVSGTRMEIPARESHIRQKPNAFSTLPPRIRALELLREHVEGKRPDAKEADLMNAIDALKYDQDSEVASMLAHVASFSPHQSVKEKARAVLCEF